MKILILKCMDIYDTEKFWKKWKIRNSLEQFDERITLLEQGIKHDKLIICNSINPKKYIIKCYIEK